MNKALLFLLVSLTFRLAAQNLVPNPGFEIRTGCPSGPGQCTMAEGWFSVNAATPDYFNDCSNAMEYGTEFNEKGGQIPHSGHAYMGFVSEDLHRNPYYEYIGTRLTDPLNAGQTYCIRIYVSRGKSTSALHELGAVFSQTKVKVSSVNELHIPYISLKDQDFLSDTEGWICLKASFTAKGGESFLTIGDFGDDSNFVLVYNDPKLDATFKSAYYFIDDVSVEPSGIDGCRCEAAK